MSVAIPRGKAGEEGPTDVGLNYTQPRPKSASEKEDFFSAGSRSSTAETAAGDRSPTAASPEGGPEGTFQRGAGRLESLTRGWPDGTGLRMVRHQSRSLHATSSLHDAAAKHVRHVLGSRQATSSQHDAAATKAARLQEQAPAMSDEEPPIARELEHTGARAKRADKRSIRYTDES